MNCVMDACALIAFLRAEPGGDVVRDILHDPSNRCVAHAINVCEVFYDFVRVRGEQRARAAVRDITAMGLHIRRDMSARFWMNVGRLKGTQRLSLADCFAVELSRRINGEVVTSDHHEFDALLAQRVCRVRFIR